MSESGTCPEREGALRRWRATRDLWVGGRGGLQAAGQTWSWYGVSCRLRRSPRQGRGPRGQGDGRLPGSSAQWASGPVTDTEAGLGGSLAGQGPPAPPRSWLPPRRGAAA